MSSQNVFSVNKDSDFDPSQVKRLNPHRQSPEGVMSSDDEDNYRESGTGILEFSPQKAGMDVTPANYNCQKGDKDKRHSGVFSSVAGKNKISLSFTIDQVYLECNKLFCIYGCEIYQICCLVFL